jgi:hypothetical protein
LDFARIEKCAVFLGFFNGALTGADWPTAAIDGDVGAVPEGTTWIDKLTLRLPTTYATLGTKSATVRNRF